MNESPGEHRRPWRTRLRDRGHTAVTRWQALMLFLFVVAAFAVLALRSDAHDHQIRTNSARIELALHEQCQIRNEAAVRQIALIDSAIAAERRRPKPDPRRIKDLIDFKPALADCGPAPGR